MSTNFGPMTAHVACASVHQDKPCICACLSPPGPATQLAEFLHQENLCICVFLSPSVFVIWLAESWLQTYRTQSTFGSATQCLSSSKCQLCLLWHEGPSLVCNRTSCAPVYAKSPSVCHIWCADFQNLFTQLFTHSWRSLPHIMSFATAPQGLGSNHDWPHGLQIPSQEQVSSVTEELRGRSVLPDYLKKVLKSLPEGTHPMTQLSIAIMALQVFVTFYHMQWRPQNAFVCKI